MRVFRGNAIERGDGGGSPGQSYLFFLTVRRPGIGLSGDRVQWPEELGAYAESGVLPTPLENPREGISLALGRTHNRSRSPR
jgi:hypothetical protein